MAEDTPEEEKTEEPTARRLEKGREDGEVPRSQELTVAAVMISVKDHCEGSVARPSVGMAIN